MKSTITTLYYTSHKQYGAIRLASARFIGANAAALVAITGASAVTAGGVLLVRAVVAVALVLLAGAAAALGAASFAVLALGAVASVSHWCEYVFVGRRIRY